MSHARVLIAGPDITHEEFVGELRKNPARVVVVPKNLPWLSPAQMIEFMNAYPALWLIDPKEFEAAHILEFINTGKVRALLKPNEDVASISKKLFAEIESNNRKTSRATRENLIRTNDKMKALTAAMIGIQRASSIGEIEMVLNEALNPALKLTWVRVLFSQQSSMRNEMRKNVAAFDFHLKSQHISGKILFGREKPARFTVSEKEFLKEITDTTSLALERLGKLDEAETLKQQWEATFDAISHPLCITDLNNTLLRTNRSFSNLAGAHYRDLLGQNALTAFFQDPKLKDRVIETPFHGRFTKGEGLAKKEFEAVSQSLVFELDGMKSRLWLFQDVTDQVKLERRILESSKLAELGTIASSIAHELNNPLGGMLSYLQLIRMDLQKTEPLYEDIMAMEEATLRCRDIIQNLLGFARLRGERTLEETDLRDAIQRAVKLIELQTRSKGIEVSIQLADGPAPVMGQLNALSQALCNILQNAIDAVSERMQQQKKFLGKIDLVLDRAEEHYQIRISDNGLGIDPEHQHKVFTPLFSTKAPNTNTGLGLTVAFSILQDHGGELEIFSQTGSGTTAVLQIPQKLN
jgi:two-component system, NtrC family, sensor kinase